MTSQGPLKTDQWRVPNEDFFEGRFCRLERLKPAHFDDLHRVRTIEDAESRYQYLFSLPPVGREDFTEYMTNLQNSTEYITYAVIDKRTNRAEGFQSFMTLNPKFGTIEIGGILWGPEIARSPVTTEAFYLFSRHVFDDLHYRRYEWKCNNANTPSRNAALRFGFQFEGVFRKHLIQNGWNRDTAYFSMIDDEWPQHKVALEQWLSESNFDESGKQIKSLGEIRDAIA